MITFNGEIYNHAELRRELENRGHRFKTDHSDTEVFCMDTGNGARLSWIGSMECGLSRLYDRAKNELFLSRDRFGKKPLFYFSDNRNFVFASELTALRLHPAVP